jgi:molybdenum cofactor cytidylyltransferase
MEEIEGIILAAGESKRMSSPKALLKIGSETFVTKIRRIMVEVGIQSIFVVTGAHKTEIEEHLRGMEHTKLVWNARYQEGQFSSLKTCLLQVPQNTPAVLVWPVDQPLIQKATVELLLSQWRNQKNHVVIPVLQSKRGHPVIYDNAAIQTILSLDATHTAKDLQAIYSKEILYVEVQDSGILIDIDSPEDYRKYITDAGL